MSNKGWQELEISAVKDQENLEVDKDEFDIEGVSEDTEGVDTSLDVEEKKVAPSDAEAKKARRLKQELAELRSASLSFAQQNQELKEEILRTKRQAAKQEKNLYRGNAEGLDKAIGALKAAYAQALATSDYEKAADLQVEMQQAIVKQQAYKAVAEEEEEEVEDSSEHIEPEKKQRQTSQQKLPAALVSWLDDNTWFKTPDRDEDEVDMKKTRVAIRISDELIREGYSAQEDDFYTELSARLNKETAPKKTETKRTANTLPQKGEETTALVRKDGKIYLKYTKEDVEMAKRLGLYDSSDPKNTKFRRYLEEKLKDSRDASNTSGYIDIG